MSCRLIAAIVGALLLMPVAGRADCPELAGHLPGGFTAAVTVVGEHAYLGSGRGLVIADVSDPRAPLLASEMAVSDFVRDIAVAGGYAYLATTDRLVVVDVSTASAPVEIGSAEFGAPDATGRAVSVAGGYAYVAAGDAGLRVIDVGTPAAPAEVGSLDMPGFAWDVAVDGGYAYVAGGEAGLRVIDLFHPSAPVEVGAIDFYWESAVDVVVVGGFAYVDWMVPFPHTSGGMTIVDVRTPSAPVQLGSVGVPGDALGVAVAGTYAYVIWSDVDVGRAGLRVVDVTIPSTPVDIADFDAESTAVAAAGAYVFLAAGGEGMYVLWECARRDPRVSFIPAAAVAAGARGSHFQTDVEINNTGDGEAEVVLEWLPRGDDNSVPIQSSPVALAPGQSRRFENVLAEVFGLGPDSVGALKMASSTESVIGMSRTYNIPAGESGGTFGQGLPSIRSTEMMEGTEPKRITFLSESPDFRANLGCVNGTDEPLRINIGLFDDEGSLLGTRTMDLRPYSNDQINRVFRDWAPVSGYLEVSADRGNALYSCYGSLLDNSTSDPTTILPLLPSDERIFIPAAALTNGLGSSFFQTDVDLNNVGSTGISFELLWLPRGANNSDPLRSDTLSLAPGAGVRYANVLREVFGLEPDQVGALAVEASGVDLLAMSRTYNLQSAEMAGTFGQGLPGIPADRMIPTGVKKRILFMNENLDLRSNVGCQNCSQQTVRVFIELYSAEGESLEVRTMDLPPLSNNQITRVFRNYAPVEAGYVDVWTTTPGASIICYGSVLDSQTNDPTTVLPQ